MAGRHVSPPPGFGEIYQRPIPPLHRKVGGADSQVLTVVEVPSTWPAAPRACAAKYGPPAWVEAELSKPVRGNVATAVRALGELPASSRQDATVVAPFQLAYAVL
jgi:hypothetical protein